MAISFVASGDLFTSTSSGSGFQLRCPTGIQDGDLILAVMTVSENTTTSVATGFTELGHEGVSGSGDDQTLFVFAKDAVQADDNGTTYSFSDGNNLGTNANRRGTRVFVYRGTGPVSSLTQDGFANSTSNGTSAFTDNIGVDDGDWWFSAVTGRWSGSGGNANWQVSDTSDGSADNPRHESNFGEGPEMVLGVYDGEALGSFVDVEYLFASGIFSYNSFVSYILEVSEEDTGPTEVDDAEVAEAADAGESISATLSDADSAEAEDDGFVGNDVVDDGDAEAVDAGESINVLNDDPAEAADESHILADPSDSDAIEGDDAESLNLVVEESPIVSEQETVVSETTPRIGEYDIFVDWDDDAGLTIGNFEAGTTQGWESSSGGSVADLSVTTTRSHLDHASMAIDWNSTTTVNRRVLLNHTGLISGESYTYTLWSYTASTGNGMTISIGVDGEGSTSVISTTDEWVQHTHEFTASSTDHVLEIFPASTPSGGERTYVDQIMIYMDGEDVTDRTLGLRQALEFRRGRDNDRSLSAISTGDMAMELNNMSLDYSPENSMSPLFGLLRPGHAVLVRERIMEHTWNMFSGYIDDYTITPGRDKRSVEFRCLDMFTKLSEYTLSTSVYPSLRSGQVLNVILDEIGWPEDRRDIDQGASTIRWWWAEGKDALSAVQEIAESEGNPAFAFIDASGNFIFRDRHHRLTSSRSTTSQRTFRDDGTEPTFDDFTYDIGWRDVINVIDVEVEERSPGNLAVVWESDDTFALDQGQTLVLSVEADEPFVDAIIPRENPILPVDGELGTDYILDSGDVTTYLSRRSGQTAEIHVYANSASVVTGMRLRAHPVPVARKYNVRVSDSASVALYGERVMQNSDILPLTSRRDAESIAETYLAQRSRRLPVVRIEINNGHAVRIRDALRRNLSDRIRIVEEQTATDHEFFVESIEHTIRQIGYDHRVVLGCERLPVEPEDQNDVFTLDDDSKGFDQGAFGQKGEFVTSGTSGVFIVGESDLGGSDGLGY